MNTKLIRTPSSASNRKTFTISLWFKIGLHPYTDGAGGNSRELVGQTSSSYFRCIIKEDGTIRIYDESGFNYITNRKFRDKSAFYHLVIRADTTQATANDRVRVYINGLDERTVGGYSTDTAPSQNQDFAWNVTAVHQFGGHSNGYDYFSGVMSHIHHCDGTSLAPTVFGSTDSTTGEWQINAAPTFTPGTNGFTILKDGNTITDQSANSNNFTLQSGTLTKTEDNPSNVFCTMNPLDAHASMAFANGNTTTVSPSNTYMPCKATIGMLGQNGKFYWEGKCLSGSAHYFGVYDASGTVRGSVQSDMDSNRFVYTYQGGIERTITGQSAIGSGTYATFANGDIIGVGLDKVNGTITFWKNGTQIYTETHSSLQTKDLIAGTQAYGSDINWNFGNGFFGTTAVSSAGTNASGNGIFEYNVPANYTALSTKGLNL